MMAVNQAAVGANIMNPLVVYSSEHAMQVCGIFGVPTTNSGVVPPLPCPGPSTRDLESSNNLDRDYVRVLAIRMRSNGQCLPRGSADCGGETNNTYALRLSLRPLLALRIAFRECDVFFFGTASKNGGNNSNSESSGDAVHLNDVHVDAWGKKDARFGRKARAESATVVAIMVSVLGV